MTLRSSDLGADFDPLTLDHVLVVHHQDIRPLLVIAHGHIRHQEGFFSGAHDRGLDPGKQARQDLEVRIGEDPPQLQGAGGGGDGDGGEIEIALVGIAGFVGQTEVQGPELLPALRVSAGLVHDLAAGPSR